MITLYEPERTGKRLNLNATLAEGDQAAFMLALRDVAKAPEFD